MVKGNKEQKNERAVEMKDKEKLHFNVSKASSTLLSSAQNGKNVFFMFLFENRHGKLYYYIKASNKRSTRKQNFNCARMLLSFCWCKKNREKRTKLTFQCLHWHWQRTITTTAFAVIQTNLK